MLPHQHILVRGQQREHLVPKVMQVLLYLAERPGAVVTREELLDVLWSDAPVNDEVVTRAISTLRQVFDDDFRQPAYIETLPKVGYRLIAKVEPLDDRSEDANEARPSAQRIAWMAAAVLLLLLAGFVWLQWQGATGESFPPMQQRPLTTLPGTEFDPALSPDGTRIVFVHLRDVEGRGRRADLYVKNLETESLVQLTDEAAWELGPAWSPSGQHIAFMRLKDPDCTIFLIPAAGGPERRLADCGENMMADLAWSPDGRYLVYSDAPSPGAPFGLVLLNVETGARRWLTRPEAPRVHMGGDTKQGGALKEGIRTVMRVHISGDTDPAVSPDGRQVAFIRRGPHPLADVFIVSVQDSTVRRLTHHGRPVEGLAWMPDGQSLLFAIGGAGDHLLWRIAVDGGPAERVESARSGMRNPTAATAYDGQVRMAGEHWIFDTDIWRVAPASAADPAAGRHRLIASTRMDNSPHVAPDGSRLAFASDRSGHYEVWVSNIDGTAPVRITSTNSNFITAPRWAPNGYDLVFERHQDGTSDIYVTNTDGAAPRRLTFGAAYHIAPRWSHDGRWVYAGSDRGGTWQIWKVPAEGGAPVQVTHQGGVAVEPSADGRTLYVARPDTTGIWRVSLGVDGEPKQVFDTVYRGDWLRWTLTPDGVYYVDWSVESGDAIFFFDFASGAIRRIYIPEKPLLLNTALAVSPDGRQLFYTQIDRRESDLVLLEAVP